MQIIQQYCEWYIPPPPNTLELLELCGRVAYKSEDKITPGSAERFLKVILTKKHESVLEHIHATMRFVTDRGVSHEIVRHRIASFTQESTRYVNYSKRGVSVISPADFALDDDDIDLLYKIEEHYNNKIKNGMTPQQARFFLPTGLKTEVVMTCNLREWRHVFGLRLKPDAHPQMVDLMRQALAMFQAAVPILFDDFWVMST